MQPHGPGLNGRPGAGGSCRWLGMDLHRLLLCCGRDGLGNRRRRRPGRELDRRLLAACGKCLPGSEPTEVCMVRRRSTVRFRKGAPGCERFSNMKPSTCFGRVAFECVKRPVARVLVTRRFAAGWAAQSDSCMGNRSWIGWALGAHRQSYLRSCGSTKSDEHSGPRVIRVHILPADYARAVGGVLDGPEVRRTACSGWARLTGRRRPGRQLALGLHLSRRIASVPVTGGWWRPRGRFAQWQRGVSQGRSWWLPPRGSSPRGCRRRSAGTLSRRRKGRRPCPGSRLGWL